MKEFKTYLAKLIYYVNFKLLANIYSFVIQNLIQHVHRASCTFKSFTTQYGGGSKTKSRLECRHRILGRETKKGISCIILIPLVVSGVPNEI